MRLCAEGLLAGRAERLVRDNIDAELARHIEGAEAELLQGVVCQAGLARDIAAALFPRPPSNADPYWVNDARLLFTGIASFVMESPAILNEKKTFATILEIMNGAEQPLLEFIGSLREDRRRECSHFTLQTLLPYFEMSERQFSGIYAGVRTGMAPFLNERLMRAT